MVEHSVPFTFFERSLPYGRSGVQIGIEVTRVLYDRSSDFGHVQVFDTEFYGRMLVIDDIVQASVSDEFIYHEMLALTPMVRHGRPSTALIIGGGDGGAIRQALRVATLESVAQVEIDATVIEASRKHLPELSEGAFEDPRCTLILDDGHRFLSQNTSQHDVLILDLTDPVPGSPAEALFESEFFAHCARALAPGGVLAMQCGSLVFQPDEAATMRSRLRSVFGHVELHHAVIPSYQLTSFGFLVASNEPPPAEADVSRRFALLDGPCRHLSPAVYQSSQVLPPHLSQVIHR